MMRRRDLRDVRAAQKGAQLSVGEGRALVFRELQSERRYSPVPREPQPERRCNPTPREP